MCFDNCRRLAKLSSMGLHYDAREIMDIAIRSDVSERTVRRYIEDPNSVRPDNREAIELAMFGPRDNYKAAAKPPVAKAKPKSRFGKIAERAKCSDRTVRRYFEDPNSVTQGHRARIERVLNR